LHEQGGIILKTKALLGALVIAVLAVFGLVGLRQAQDAKADTIATVSAFNPTSTLVGGQSSFTIQIYPGAPNTDSVTIGIPTGAAAANFSFATTVPSCGTATINNAAVPPIATLNTTGCPGNGSVVPVMTWVVTIQCLTANPTGTTTPITVTSNPGTALAGVYPTQFIACVTQSPAGAGSAATNSIMIHKVDQFGQNIQALFSIQASPFWNEVARVNLFATANPCDTAGNGGTPFVINSATSPSPCANIGVVSPQLFANGLPNGTYRVVEIASPSADAYGNPTCTLVQVYNGISANGQSPANAGFYGSVPQGADLLTQPVTLTLPDPNPMDLQLTFVNSCLTPGGPSTATSSIAVVIGGSQLGITDTSHLETNPAPGNASSARLDIRARDTYSIPIPNAHVTVLIDKGVLAMRRDVSSYPNPGGYDVIEPAPGAAYFGSNLAGDTCAEGTNGWLLQSVTTGSYNWPFITSSRQQQDGYTNTDGIISACVFVDTTLAPGVTPGKLNVQAIVESPAAGGLYPTSTGYYTYPNNLSVPNYLAAPNIVLTAQITVVGPPASITVAAAPTSLNCGEKATITVTVKDAAGQNVSDHTRVEFVTNYGGVIGGTTATLGPVAVTGGDVYPVSSSSAETFNGVATAYLLTSTDHVGPYEVVAAAGGSTLETSANYPVNPYYTNLTNPFDPLAALTSGGFGAPYLTPTASYYYPWMVGGGQLTYTPSTAPVNAQATVTCAVPGAPAAAVAAPAIAAPRTGQGPADAFAIRPPNTGDAGLASSHNGNGWTLYGIAALGFALSGLAVLKFARR
jgi:hypothetical protein